MKQIRASLHARWIVCMIAIAAGFLASLQEIQAQARSNLYMVSGYPSADSESPMATRLYRLSQESNTLDHVIELTETDTAFIRAYHDLRLLLIATPHFRLNRLILERMDDPCHPRFIDVSGYAFLPLKTFLLDIPEKGLFLALKGYAAESHEQILHTISLDTGSEQVLDSSDLRFARLPGLSGLGHEDSYQMEFLIEPSGFLEIPWWDKGGERLIDLGWPPLPNASRALREKNARWPIHAKNKQAMGSATWWVGTSRFDLVMARGESSAGNELTYHLFDRSKAEWRQVMVPGEEPGGLTQLKPFGPWLAGVPLGKRIQGFPPELSARVRSENRQDDYRFSDLLKINPKAEIFIYDTESGESFTIRTGDIESAVLLIEDNVVYYRVKDRLYTAAIRKGHVAQPELLAQDPALASVYWAFWGPPCEPAEAQGEK